MKKFFTLALLALFGLNASAQEVTLDLTTNDSWNLPTEYVKTEATYTNTSNGVTLTFGASSNGHKINPNDGYLIFGKKDATLTIGSFDFAVERIDIVGRAGASGATEQNIFVGDEPVSTKTTGATSTNVYEIAEAYQSAGSFTLKILSNHNTQITQILIWKKGSGTKKAAGLSWGTNSRTVTLGADDNVFPTLTNENGLSIIYDSSNKECATISEDGAITLVAAGKTDISAEFAGNDEYEAQTVKYTLTVKNAPVNVTVTEALKIIADLEDGATTTDDYIVTGYIVTDPAFGRKADNSLYGNVDFDMADTKDATENLLTVYRGKNIGNTNFTEETLGDIAKGYSISIQGQLQKYVKDEVVTPEVKNGYLVSITPTPKDVVLTLDEGCDISAAIDAELGSAKAKSIKIILNDAAFTITKPITCAGNIDFSSTANTTIDASALEGQFIVLDGSEEFAMKDETTPSDHYLIKNVTVEGVIINGLSSSFIKDNQKTLLETLNVINCKIEMPANNKNFIDFNGKGYVGKVKVDNSTIWANDKNTGFFAQYGSRPKNINGEWLQEFDVQNSTIVNIANGKNICDLKQNGTAQNVYTLKDNLFVDCGKQNQVVVGFNKGQTSATPVWTVSGNAFNWGGADVSAAEIEKAGQKDGEDIVKNSVAGVIAFTDAANGDFNGKFTLAAGATAPSTGLGDTRWTIEFTSAILLGDANKDGVIDVADVVAIVNYILEQPAENFDAVAADANEDQTIDVSDVVAVVNIILGQGGADAARVKAVLLANGFIF